MRKLDAGRGRWAAALVLVATLLLALPAWARTVLELDSPGTPVPLLDWGDAWLDGTGQAGPDRIATDAAIPWEPSRPAAIYPLATGRALWMRFTIPPAPDAERWYLQIPYPSVNRVTLFTQDSVGQWLPQVAGDSVPVARWPVPHRDPLLPVVVSAEEPRHYLLKVENSHSFSAPVGFVSESYLSRYEQRTSLILGIYFGLAGLAALLSALSAVSLRDTAYGLYAVTVTLMGLTQASLTGIAGLHLWPHMPVWNDLAPLVLPVLGVGSLLWFFSAVVSLPQRSRTLHWLMLGLGALALAVAVAIVLAEPSQRFKLMVPYVSGALTVATAAVVWAGRRGDRYAYWLVAGSVPVLVSAVFPLARTAGLIPVTFWTTHAMQIGIALELPILLVMLMLRSQHRREHNRRMQGLDRIDPATGLINEHVFRERLLRLVAVSQRLKLRSAVLLVDIANVEQVREQFGARSAQELPLRVAGRLLSAAREIDSVARLGEHRFGMLLEGPLTAEEVAAAGPRIVARCLMPFKRKPVDWVAQARIAQALVPLDGTDPDRLLADLDALLASVPADDKRAVFPLARPAAAVTVPAAF